MSDRLRTLIDFYRSPSALMFLVGLGFLLLRLLNIGPTTITSLIAISFIGAGLPLRLHSQTRGLHILLEEERQITHRRLSELEKPDGSETGQI